MANDFIECDTCKAKPGTPTLCAGCLANRKSIADLREDLDAARSWIRASAQNIKTTLDALLEMTKP